MNYTEVLASLNQASLFDLYRIKIAIENALENPAKIAEIKRAIQIGDTILWFDDSANKNHEAIVLEKNLKTLSVRNLEDETRWRIFYHCVNLASLDTEIKKQKHEILTKNHLQLGQYLGFHTDHGEVVTGAVIRLNHKTATIVTKDRKRWRVSYSLLFKVIDSECEKIFDTYQLQQMINEEGRR